MLQVAGEGIKNRIHSYKRKKKERPSFTHMLCGVWAEPRFIRLQQVFPFHKEPKQLDVQIERHVEEGLLSGEQLLVKARGEAREGHTPCLVSTGSAVDSDRHKANTAGALAAVRFTSPIVCRASPLPGAGRQPGTLLFGAQS